MKRILICTSDFSFRERGAEEADRTSGILQLKNFGYELTVYAKTHAPLQAQRETVERAHSMGIKLVYFPYRKKSILNRINPRWLDGASLEYRDPGLQVAIKHKIESWHPDVVWLEPSFLWPLARTVRRLGVPIIMRSVNFESQHYLQEAGIGPFTLLKAASKLLNEYTAAHSCDVLFAISPDDRDKYKKFGAKYCAVLPLRKLPDFLKFEHIPKETKILHVAFAGSSYNVRHNLAAARMIIEEIAPTVNQLMPGVFVFHIFGAKLPAYLQRECLDNVIYESYVPNLDRFYHEIDIALAPKLYGGGMQQKVFEPIVRGIPTITSKNALVGYPMRPSEEVLLAHSPKEYADRLIDLADVTLRKQISAAAQKSARNLFSQEILNQIIVQGLSHIA